jgi:hypothetical protein
MTGGINMSGQKLNGLNAPTADDDAATKSYVDNAFGMVLLWENASPTSEFAEQDIKIPVHDFKIFIEELRNTTTDEAVSFHMLELGKFARPYTVPSGARDMATRPVASSKNSSGVGFHFWTASSAETSGHLDKAIPVRLYGIRGIG